MHFAHGLLHAEPKGDDLCFGGLGYISSRDRKEELTRDNEKNLEFL